MKGNTARACQLLLVLGVVLAAGISASAQTGGCSVPANVVVNDGFEYNTADDVPTNIWRQDKLESGAWTFVTSPVFGGLKASSITIHQCDLATDCGTSSERDEVQEQGALETQELVPLEKTMRYYVPASFPYVNIRLVTTQWKQREGILPPLGPAHPVLAMRYRSGVMWVELEYDDNFQIVLWSTTADMRGRWFTLTYRTLFDRTGNTGYIKLWLDGVQVANYQGVSAYPTNYQYNPPSQQTYYFKFGLYRNTTPDVWTIYNEDYLNCTVSADTSPDFRLAFSPIGDNQTGYKTITAGSTATYTVTVTPQNGFTGTTNLSVSNYGWPAGTTASLNPTSVTGSGSSTLTVTTSSTTSSGSYPASVIGTSGSLSHSTTGALVVNPPSSSADFSISAEPAPQAAVAHGSSGQYSIKVTALNNFSGTVNQSVSGLPAGATASFNPTSVTPDPTTGSGTSVLTVTTSSTTPVGTYVLTLTGASGSLTRSSLLYLIVN